MAAAIRHDEHVLVVGCGYVGEVAARLLAATGRRVTGVRRSVVAPVPGVTMLALDVHDPTQREQLPDDADVVIVALSPGGREADRYRATYVDAPAAVVAHQRETPRLLLLTTSTAVYGQDDGSWVDESSPTDPASPTAQILVEAEAALSRLDVPSTSARLGGIYGPGRTRLLRQVAAGEASCTPGMWTNRIHRDDAASALVHLVAQEQPLGPAVNVVDDHPTLQCEVLDWLAARLDAPLARRAQPEDDARSQRAMSKRVSNDLLRRSDWHPVHSAYDQGYASLVDAARK